jgi:hypothetical protein
LYVLAGARRKDCEDVADRGQRVRFLEGARQAPDLASRLGPSRGQTGRVPQKAPRVP